MSSKQVLWGLVPWLLYAVLTIPDGDRAGLVAAVVAVAWAVAATVARDSHRDVGRRSSTSAAFAVFGDFALIEAARRVQATRQHPRRPGARSGSGRPRGGHAGLGCGASVHRAVHPRRACRPLPIVAGVPVRPSRPEHPLGLHDRGGRDQLSRSRPTSAPHRDPKWWRSRSTWLVPLGAVAIAARQSKVSASVAGRPQQHRHWPDAAARSSFGPERPDFSR